LLEKNLLSTAQTKNLREFYSYAPTLVVLSKVERTEIWNQFITHREALDTSKLLETCPALYWEMQKAVDADHNVQSAVASECAFAQTLANIYQLINFDVFHADSDLIPTGQLIRLKELGLSPRYVYWSDSGDRFLIQAGGFAGVDSALVSIFDDEIFTIEFKEPWAKTSEPDLPPYGEDGLLTITDSFLVKYPQFQLMVAEKIRDDLNFFKNIGNNINSFSAESIEFAVMENYQGAKYAGAICTEDKNGVLTMVPANQVHLWARLEGEIRPAGRNHYKVWTPERLAEVISRLGGTKRGSLVSIGVSSLKQGKPRGGKGISRYKLDSVFFLKAASVEIRGHLAKFKIEQVRQLRPTIAAKMSFEELEFESARDRYLEGTS